MSTFSYSAGVPVSATSGAAPPSKTASKTPPRRAVARSRPSEAAFALEFQAGKLAGVRSAAELLRRVRDAEGPEDYHFAVLKVRNSLLAAGAATSGPDKHSRAGHAAYALAEMMTAMVAFGARHSDLEEFIDKRLDMAEREGAFIVQHVAKKRCDFVQRMREGRERKARERLGQAPHGAAEVNPDESSASTSGPVSPAMSPLGDTQ
jgi:hypothetical protein